MSFDIFVQGFHRGVACDADATALRAALAPHLVEERYGWSLRAGASTAEICGVEDLTSFMVTHVDGVEILDLLVRVAEQFDLVILAPGAPAAITRAGQRQHLPGEISVDARLVTTGAELRAIMAVG